MLSAMGQAKNVAESLAAGAVDFIVKPFQADRLIMNATKHTLANIELDIEKIKEWQKELLSLPDDAGAKPLTQAEIDELIEKFKK